jgi:hypothetical protein
MMPYTLILTTRAPRLDPQAMTPRGAQILDAFAEIAAIEVKRDVWNYSMFRYIGIKPKPVFSKSERAWKGAGDAADLSITLSNDATNKRGVVYIPYVHLSGRPKSDKLVRYVQAHLVEKIAPRAARAIIADMIKAADRVETRAVKV